MQAGKNFWQYQIIDAKEQRRKRERERYADMTDEKKQEKLKMCREVYQQKKEKISVQQRQIYANMQSEQKKARIEQITNICELGRNTLNKDSITMVNPLYQKDLRVAHTQQS